MFLKNLEILPYWKIYNKELWIISKLLRVAAISWDAMLIMVKIELELMPDSDMYKFFEMGLELEFLIFLIDIVKPTISTENQEKNIYT